MLKATHCRQQGFMAIVLVVFLVVFVAIAAAIVSMTTSGARSAGDHAMASGALFIAESGIEWAAKELAEAADPESYCNDDLPGSGGSVNSGGAFEILEAEYLDDPALEQPVCRVRVAGVRNTARRVLSTNIKIASAESIFDNQAGWDDTKGAQFPDPALPVLQLSSNPGCKNDAYAITNSPADVLTDSFSDGDQVYFASELELVSGNSDIFSLSEFQLNLAPGIANCVIPLLSPSLSPCAAPSGHPLYDDFDIVLDLGSDFGAGDVGQIELVVDWDRPGGPPVDCPAVIELSNACLGREGHCAVASDDPIEDGSWDENP